MTSIIIKLHTWTPGRLPAILAACGAERLPDKVIPQLRLARAVVPEDGNTDAIIAALRAHPDIQRAYLDLELQPFALGPYYQSTIERPTTTQGTYADAWGALHRYLGAGLARGSSAVKLAILDTGAVPHVDLPTWGAGNTYSFDNDSTDPLDIYALGDPNGNELYSPNRSHGTFIAGQIFATSNNGLGITGIAAGCTALIGRVYPVGPSFTVALLCEGILWAADNGAAVINCSGGLYFSADPGAWTQDQVNAYADMSDAVAYALGLGSSFVAAIGNDMYPTESMTIVPAEIPGVISVGAADIEGDRGVWGTGSGSNYGPAVDICCSGGATGAGLNSTVNDDDACYAYNDDSTNPFPLPSGLISTIGTGTSFAAPQVVAVLGLIATANPSLTRAEREDILLSTRIPFSNTTDFPNAGYLDPVGAVRKALSTRVERATSAIPHLRLPGVPSVTAGVATKTLSGGVTLDIGGYAQSGIEHVELWIGDSLVYSGPPATIAKTAEYSGTANALRVIAYGVAGGNTEETYNDVLVTTFAAPAALPHTIRIEANGTPVLATLSPGAEGTAATAVTTGGAIRISGFRAAPFASTTTSARGFAHTAVSSLSADIVTSASEGIGILTTTVGHRIRAVANGTPVVAQLTPGADSVPADITAYAANINVSGDAPVLAASVTPAAGDITLRETIPTLLPGVAATTTAATLPITASRSLPASSAPATGASIGGATNISIPLAAASASASTVVVSLRGQLSAVATSTQVAAGALALGAETPIFAASCASSASAVTYNGLGVRFATSATEATGLLIHAIAQLNAGLATGYAGNIGAVSDTLLIITATARDPATNTSIPSSPVYVYKPPGRPVLTITATASDRAGNISVPAPPVPVTGRD